MVSNLKVDEWLKPTSIFIRKTEVRKGDVAYAD